MSIHRAVITLTTAASLALFLLFTVSAAGQSPTTQPPIANKEVAQVKTAQPVLPDAKATPSSTPSPDDLQSDLAAVKAENAIVRELLKKMEEQQKTLLEQVDRLQKRLDGSPAVATDQSVQPQGAAGLARDRAANGRLSRALRRSSDDPAARLNRSMPAR